MINAIGFFIGNSGGSGALQVAVNFPVGSEATENSSTISSTNMNIIVFQYFANYDGLGNGKVLYTNILQTSV